MRIMRSLAAAAALLLSAGAANAAVLYEFSNPSASFSVTVPDFIAADTEFSPSQLDACEVGGSSSNCAGVGILPVGPAPTADTIRFDYTYTVVGDPTPYPGTAYYLFANGAFAQAGTYESTTNRGTFLRISGSPDAVPEPATWAMLIAGFGLTGAALRRRTLCEARAAALA